MIVDDVYESRENPLQHGCGGFAAMWAVGENSIFGFCYYYGARKSHGEDRFSGKWLFLADVG